MTILDFFLFLIYYCNIIQLKTKTMLSGFILINKALDWTSNDVTVYIRTKVAKTIKRQNPHIKHVRVGHAGTLDPFATGLLIVAIGRQATRQIEQYKNLPKIYETTIQLGATSDSYDITGKITQSPNYQIIESLTQQHIEIILKHFIGKQRQIPPMHSAKKVDGKRLYNLARKGIEIERKPCDIDIHTIDILDWDKITYQLTIRVSCSTGTYIRSLAHDIGKELGVGGYCKTLHRTAIGDYQVSDAINIEGIRIEDIETHIIPIVNNKTHNENTET